MITGHDFTQKYEKIRDGIIFNVTKILSCKTKYLGFKTYTCPKCSNVKQLTAILAAVDIEAAAKETQAFWQDYKRQLKIDVRTIILRHFSQ